MGQRLSGPGSYPNDCQRATYQNLLGHSHKATAARLGAPPLAGLFMLSAVAFVLAAAMIFALLRPDPLLMAREEAARVSGADSVRPPSRKSIREVLSEIIAVPSALLGLVAMAVGHAVMVGVMSQTPIHLQHGGASLRR